MDLSINPFSKFTPKDKKPKNSLVLVSITFIFSIMLLASVFSSFISINQVNGQTTNSNKLFKIIVEVTNTSNIDLLGTIHAAIDGTFITKDINNAQFPAKQTVSYTLEFNSADVPTGKGFSVEVIYGDDRYKRTFGSNTPANAPELVQISIP